MSMSSSFVLGSFLRHSTPVRLGPFVLRHFYSSCRAVALCEGGCSLPCLAVICQLLSVNPGKAHAGRALPSALSCCLGVLFRPLPFCPLPFDRLRSRA